MIGETVDSDCGSVEGSLSDWEEWMGFGLWKRS